MQILHLGFMLHSQMYETFYIKPFFFLLQDSCSSMPPTCHVSMFDIVLYSLYLHQCCIDSLILSDYCDPVRPEFFCSMADIAWSHFLIWQNKYIFYRLVWAAEKYMSRTSFLWYFEHQFFPNECELCSELCRNVSVVCLSGLWFKVFTIYTYIFYTCIYFPGKTSNW